MPKKIKREDLKLIVPDDMIQVTKNQFYAAIGPVESLMTGCHRHHYPVNCMEFRASYYAKVPGSYLGDWKLWGIDVRTLGDYPGTEFFFMSEHALNSFIIF